MHTTTPVFTTFIAMKPVAKGRPRITRTGHAYTPSATVQAEHRIQMQVASEYRRDPLVGPLQVGMVVHLAKPKSKGKKQCWPTTRPDLDNYIKMLDALNGVLWNDDSQIVHINASKQYSNTPGFELVIYQVEAA